jgi:hypothetical protein
MFANLVTRKNRAKMPENCCPMSAQTDCNLHIFEADTQLRGAFVVQGAFIVQIVSIMSQ